VRARRLASPPWQVLDQTLLAEQPQRLPQRCSDGAESPGELSLDQPLAGHQSTAEDFATQPLHRERDLAGRSQDIIRDELGLNGHSCLSRRYGHIARHPQCQSGRTP
jgi:hypothetical protein